MVYPLGDNRSVILTKTGMAQITHIYIFKKSGDSLLMSNKISRETGYFTMDVAPNGESFVGAFAPFEGVSEKPELVLFNKEGTVIWKVETEEPELFKVTVFHNNIIAATIDVEKKQSFACVFDYFGHGLFKSRLGDVSGKYDIESSGEGDRYFAISTSKSIDLFDLVEMVHLPGFFIDDGRKICSFKIDKSGNLICVVAKKKMSEDRKCYNFLNKQLILTKVSGKEQSINLEMWGEAKIIREERRFVLRILNNGENKYYEIVY